MSTQEDKKSFALAPLDCRVVKTLTDKVRSSQVAAQTHIQALALARADYDEYMGRLSRDNGMEWDPQTYQVNFITSQLEPIPPKAPPAPKKITSAPDVGEPPAPFREPDAPALEATASDKPVQ